MNVLVRKGTKGVLLPGRWVLLKWVRKKSFTCIRLDPGKRLPRMTLTTAGELDLLWQHGGDHTEERRIDRYRPKFRIYIDIPADLFTNSGDW